jgi:dTDP-4-amino-4,6-dideoxygalactose transaminase
VHRLPPYESTRPAELPVAESWAREELSLPMFPGLRADEVGAVCDRLGAVLAGAGERAAERG